MSNILISDLVFEVKPESGNIQIKALTKEGAWLPLYEFETDNEQILGLYRLPLLLKIAYAGQESQSNVHEF